ncbi:Metallo-dependent phosphatase-like protein [Podospora fimiseda]|uniref:Metallo-dependent phosphatase-like protein n=1 Tax=Podospora fimiseda TaxID=252190 RepID=A0AAN7BFQ0_9PEZI|nr:Metallo-dependent phosphatase-like protein [Podospora fimiseda]
MFPQKSSSTGLDALLSSRPEPSFFQQFCTSPTLFLARKLYAWHSSRTVLPLQSLPSQPPISVVCLSDTHNHHPSSIPDGDILIHAGDLTNSGTFSELQTAHNWLNTLSHPHKIVITGNHDLLLDPLRGDQTKRDKLGWGDIIYLQDSSATITVANKREIKIYGSPRTPKSGNWAFEYLRSEDIWRNKIPEGVDILVTHGPPKGHLDSFKGLSKGSGCVSLLKEVWMVRPSLHVLGHVHAGRGIEVVAYHDVQKGLEEVVCGRPGLWKIIKGVLRAFWRLKRVEGKTMFVNAAVVGGVRDELGTEAVKVVI